MDNKPLRVACYARYSTSMQREESISAQLRAMKKFCADNGWKIVGRYVDEAYSATTDKRPQFQQMIADSNKREFDIIYPCAFLLFDLSSADVADSYVCFHFNYLFSIFHSGVEPH